MKIIIPFLALVVFAACGDTTQNEKAAASNVETLLDEVVEGHDVAMAKMLKLERLQKETAATIDSLKKLPTELQKAEAARIAGLDSALADLKYADFAMNKWMTEFNYDSLKNQESERIQYLEGEKMKVTKMKDAVLGSIARADSLLKN